MQAHLESAQPAADTALYHHARFLACQHADEAGHTHARDIAPPHSLYEPVEEKGNARGLNVTTEVKHWVQKQEVLKIKPKMI